MIEILQNKNASTRFRILVEIAASGPAVHQRNIAFKLGITPQAISDYIRQMSDDGMITSTGRSSYQVSIKGVNWVLSMLRELNEYISIVNSAVTNLTICAAIAEHDVAKGQTIGLKMKDGLLYAGDYPGKGAKGVALSAAKKGEDLDVSNIEGLVELARGSAIILQVPSIAKGGSRKVDLPRLRTYIDNNQQVGAIGIEALVALRRIDREPRYLYGVSDAAIEAVRCGLTFIVVCSDDAISDLLKHLQEENIRYEIINLSKDA